MNNYRELLSLAAKSTGIELVEWNDGLEPYSSGVGFITTNNRLWNPQTNDGDCARMEAALGIHVAWHSDGVVCGLRWAGSTELFDDNGGDKQASRRMASLRVAAEHGKAMP